MRAAENDPSRLARSLMRSATTATLATSLSEDGWPYASLVLVATDHDGSPLLMISTLAEHTRNIGSDPRVSLLFDGTAGLDQPLTGPRLTVLGRARTSAENRHLKRYLARHPEARAYSDFADFAVYSVVVARAHLVAGFGHIHWLEASDLLLKGVEVAEIAEAETGIIEHMNKDHAETIAHYARAVPAHKGGGWTMVGCDPDGCDLRQGSELLRLPFERPALTISEVRAALIGLAGGARTTTP